MSSAVGTLRQIGALDEKENLTPLGQHLAALPVDVRVGKMLLYGAVLGCLGGALLQLDIRVVERAWLQRSNLKYDKQLSSLALNISSCGTTAGAGADHRRGAGRALAVHGAAGEARRGGRCEADVRGGPVRPPVYAQRVQRLDGGDLHSADFQLNVSAFCGAGGAFGGCLEVI